MPVILQYVETYNLLEIPHENETIEDYIDVDEILKLSNSVSLTRRYHKESTDVLVNWVLDFDMKIGHPVRYTFPPEISKKRFHEFIAPLVLKANKLKNRKLH